MAERKHMFEVRVQKNTKGKMTLDSFRKIPVAQEQPGALADLRAADEILGPLILGQPVGLTESGQPGALADYRAADEVFADYADATLSDDSSDFEDAQSLSTLTAGSSEDTTTWEDVWEGLRERM